MQRVLEQLLAEISERSREIRFDVTWLTHESQKRLMKYKELYLHKGYIDQSELDQIYHNLSPMESLVADMGVAALTFIIDALDQELC